MKAKMSELIRLGSMVSGQSFRCFMDISGNTCAQGAALLALGVPANVLRGCLATPWDHPLAEGVIKFLESLDIDPVSDEVNRIGAIIVRLNDIERWPREKIADWVESVEREQETAQSVCADENLCSVK